MNMCRKLRLSPQPCACQIASPIKYLLLIALIDFEMQNSVALDVPHNSRYSLLEMMKVYLTIIWSCWVIKLKYWGKKNLDLCLI